MTIASQLQDYSNGLVDAYDTVAARGGIVPVRKNMDNLSAAIKTIPGGGGGFFPEDFFRTDYNAILQTNALTRMDITNSQQYTVDESIGFPCNVIGYAAYAGMFGFPYFEQLPSNERVYNRSLKTLTMGDSDHTASVENGDYAFMGAFNSCYGLTNVTIYITSIINSNQVFLCSFTGGGSENDQGNLKDLVISFPKLKTITGGSKTFSRMFYPRAFYRTVTVDLSGLTQVPQNTQDPFLNMFQGLQLGGGPPTVTLRVPNNLRNYFESQRSNMNCQYTLNIVGV